MPSPQQPNDVRLRRVLDDAPPQPRWPAGYVLQLFAAEAAAELHALLVEIFDDEEPDFQSWWAARSGDPDYDPDLVFLVRDSEGRLAAAAMCWSGAYLKDLAVAPFARRNGLGEALLLQVLRAFRERGATHVDLKTNLVANADAVRLYRKHGMTEVAWEG